MELRHYTYNIYIITTTHLLYKHSDNTNQETNFKKKNNNKTTIPKSHSNGKIPTIDQCDSRARESHTVVVPEMGGALLIDSSSFAYFALIAFDVGGIFRLLLLLLAYPLSLLSAKLVSESAGMKVLVFAAFAGVKLSDIESSANAVLPKHYSEDLHPETWRVFSSCGRKCVLTSSPRIMVEPFLKNYLDVDVVLGTEISSCKGIATGFVASSGVLVGKKKVASVLNMVLGCDFTPDIAIGDEDKDIALMELCKEKYTVPTRPGVRPVPRNSIPKPVIFHDGRLVQKPTPSIALLIILWFPIAIPLCIVRLVIASLTPMSPTYIHMLKLIGCSITTKGKPPTPDHHNRSRRGVLFVCNHRTVIDPVFVSACIGRTTASITYSVSSLTEILSPIETTRLERDRSRDAELIGGRLRGGKYLVMCPEGTTCREPYLLRFSSLFAELSDEIVPVAIVTRTGLFHGTTARGFKWLDPFFFFMNPSQGYEITFSDKLGPEQTCAGGRSSHEVANSVQEMIARVLGFQCTNLTRKDKYRALARTDGLVQAW